MIYMTRVEFCENHRELLPDEILNTNDVLMRVASNLSDVQDMLGDNVEVNEYLNNIKKYMFDYMSVLRQEEKFEKSESQL